MVFNLGGADMARGQDCNEEHVVVITCNGTVEIVKGPLEFRKAQKVAAREMMEKFNALAHKVEIRPLIKIDI